jgi:hypothetical protein
MENRFGCLYVLVNIAWSKSRDIDQSNMQDGETMRSRRTAIESILFRSASRIGYLKTCPTLNRIVVEIQIRALVKAVVNRFRRGLVEISMYVCKTEYSQELTDTRSERESTYMLRSKVSPGKGGMFTVGSDALSAISLGVVDISQHRQRGCKPQQTRLDG